tara:strand:+ start:126 stop:230 length:105 start_codon:yes stop_codon:yes gene_type:complete
MGVRGGAEPRERGVQPAVGDAARRAKRLLRLRTW